MWMLREEFANGRIPIEGELVMDMNLARVLIDATQHSMRRSRWILSAISVVSMAIIAECWNLYFSWLRSIVFLKEWGYPERVADAQKLLVEHWIDSGFMSISLLGVKLHVVDATFLGSISLTILALWLWYFMRRENHRIGKALILARSADDGIRKCIYYGITSMNVFSTLSENDDPVTTLRISRNKSVLPGARMAFTFLFYLPMFVIAFMLVCDYLSIEFLGSAFRSEFHPVGSSSLTRADIIKMVFMEGCALVMGTACFFLGNYCRRYQAGNISVLREFSQLRKRHEAEGK
jgi:hypothetical protein